MTIRTPFVALHKLRIAIKNESLKTDQELAQYACTSMDACTTTVLPNMLGQVFLLQGLHKGS